MSLIVSTTDLTLFEAFPGRAAHAALYYTAHQGYFSLHLTAVKCRGLTMYVYHRRIADTTDESMSDKAKSMSQAEIKRLEASGHILVWSDLVIGKLRASNVYQGHNDVAMIKRILR